MILHKRNHTGRARRHRVSILIVWVVILRPGPVAPLDIEYEAQLRFILPPGPAFVDSPDQRRVPVGQFGKGIPASVRRDRGGGAVHLDAVVTEADGGGQLVALSHALLFVRGDALTPLGRHILQTEQIGERLA